ncbi:MAG: FAD:protein FMN transferase [Microbacterium sp.]
MTPTARWEFAAIGTRWHIDTPALLDDDARDAVREVIDRFDRVWSRFRAESLVSELAGGGDAPLPPDAAPMLELYVDLAAATHGAVNPLIGDVLARRGYDPGYGFVDRGAAAAPADWRRLLRWRDGRLRLDAPATIDVGAIGKGRLVDLVLAALNAVDGPVVVDASGDLAVRGCTQRIGLEHPYDPARAIGVWPVTDAALCASAVNRRAWGGVDGSGGLHHVLDARTGEPVRTVAATWAVSSDAMTADAAATALFFDGGARFAHEHGVAWVRMTTDGAVEWSPGCAAELFL